MNLKHWEFYYRGGAQVSCPTNPEPCYTLEVREAWASFFASLADGAAVPTERESSASAGASSQ
jgi:hypothetical protein